MKRSGRGSAVFARELGAYFNSPIAYILIFVFIVLNAGIYMSQFFLLGNADMRAFFNLLPVFLCVFVPAVTMRLWAEEKKGNTFEMLLTFPMPTSKLVLGKFAAGFVFYLITLASTLTIPFMLAAVGNPDGGQIFAGYLGAALMGAFFLSVGIFVSGLCRDQVVSFIVAMIVCFFLYLTGLDFIASVIDGWAPGAGTFLKANFGMTAHLDAFYRGVIDNRDILYFVVMTAAFLALNIFSIEDRLKPKAKVIFSCAAGVSIAISVLINFLFVDVPLGRYDLTEGKLYTVTETTKSILKALKAPAFAKLYISPAEKMPTALGTLEQDIKDRLDELRVLSGGNLRYEVFHMEAAGAPAGDEDTPEETTQGKLQERGIRPFQVRSVEQDQMDIKLVYAALSIAYKEKDEEIIPAVTPQNLNNLEYEIVSKIYRMTLEEVPQVALVAPFTRRVVDPQMRALLAQMGQAAPEQYVDDKFSVLGGVLKYEDYNFNRVQVTQESPLPAGLKTLVIVDPPALNDRQRYEINRFLREGGNVFIAAQAYEYQYGRSGLNGIEVSAQRKDTNVNDLLRPYGVSLSDKMLMDENSDTISISGAMNIGPFEVSVPVKAPMQVLVTPESMNKDVSITGRLSSMLYLWGSGLDIDDPKLKELGLTKRVLFTASKKSWALPYKSGPLTPADVAAGRSDYVPNIPLAVLVEGQFPDAFEGKDVPAWPPREGASASTEETTPKLPASAPKPGKLLVVGCFKMFQDDIIKNGGMLDFFVNSVDAMTLGGELINIRGHREIERKIKPLSKGAKLWYRFVTILAVPSFWVMAGMARALWRRKEKEQYLRLLPAKSI